MPTNDERVRALNKLADILDDSPYGAQAVDHDDLLNAIEDVLSDEEELDLMALDVVDLCRSLVFLQARRRRNIASTFGRVADLVIDHLAAVTLGKIEP